MGDRLHRPQPAEVGWEESVCGEAEDPTRKCVGSLKVPPALISMYWTLVRPHTNHKVDGPSLTARRRPWIDDLPAACGPVGTDAALHAVSAFANCRRAAPDSYGPRS